MARQSQPWFRTDRKMWCVKLDGVFHNLGPDRREAMARFRELQRLARGGHVQQRAVVVDRPLRETVGERARRLPPPAVEREPRLTLQRVGDRRLVAVAVVPVRVPRLHRFAGRRVDDLRQRDPDQAALRVVGEPILRLPQRIGDSSRMRAA